MDSILEAIGNTPVIPLRRIVPVDSATVYGKYESGNPSFSIKDRIALAIIKKAKKEGMINDETVIVDATSGNTGISLAMVCAVFKLKLLLFMPEDASLERRKMFEGFGARLELTPKSEGIEGSISKAEQYMKKHTNTYAPRQFENPENPAEHRRSTAREVLDDFPEGVDALVVGVGTGGTLTGVGSVLKKKFPETQVIAVEPSASAVLSGGRPGSHKIQQLGLGFIPKNLDRSIVDRVIQVSEGDAYETTRKLARVEGILVGISSGAHVHAASRVAHELGRGKKILTFLCDAGQRYFSLDKFFQKTG